MRVIAGRLGGRTFDSPGTAKTHPMSEKMCGALFNILGDITDLTVLDAFAGSGALSFEAVSRGAIHATAVESDTTAARTIRQNVEHLDLLEYVTVTQANTSSWMQHNPDDMFDLILCDPPYDNVQTRLIKELAKHVRPKGLLILSWPGSQDIPTLLPLRLIDHRTYGEAQLIFYRR
jgi:16S rRNA (guanine966-N2)-methyltransferase